MATFTDIVNRIIESTGRSDKQTTIEGRAGDAITEIQRLHNHYFMEEIATRALVVDADDYDVPTDFKDPINVWLIDSTGAWGQKPIEFLSLEEGRFRWNVTDEGDPEAYSVYRRSLFVWPPKPKDATKSLLLEYYKFLPTISGSQSNELTITWPDLIEAWATWKFYSKLPNAEDQATFWQKQAEPQFAELKGYSNRYRMKSATRMKVRTTPTQTQRPRGAIVFGGR